MERILLLFLPFLLLSCNKPEPKPEIRDPIYQEYISQLGLAKKAIMEAQKTLIEKKSDIEKVRPQTGQIKYAQKRYWDTQKAIDALLQQEKYWAAKIQERETFARTEYIKAFRSGKTWPDPKEFQEYSTEKRLREARLQWDTKDRIDKFKNEALKDKKESTHSDNAKTPPSGEE